jgi:hypothetical protein
MRATQLNSGWVDFVDATEGFNTEGTEKKIGAPKARQLNPSDPHRV